MKRRQRIDDLTLVADELLSGESRDPDRPWYCEETFRRKLALAHRREAAAPLAMPDLGAQLLTREWNGLIGHAHLTACQREVLLLRLQGMTYEAIGVRRGHTKQGAKRIFQQAAGKIAEARETYPFCGLAEVYREETRRRGANRTGG